MKLLPGMTNPGGVVSPPTRGRGLKPYRNESLLAGTVVAPHAGAWIETDSFRGRHRDLAVAPHAGAWIETRYWPQLDRSPVSPPTRGRGLKHPQLRNFIPPSDVAPHAGAWIETIFHWMSICAIRSPPTRGRGLKLQRQSRGDGQRRVAPHAGAWIETYSIIRYLDNSYRRPPRGGVD